MGGRKIGWQACTRENSIQVTDEELHCLEESAFGKVKSALAGINFVLKQRWKQVSGCKDDKIDYKQRKPPGDATCFLNTTERKRKGELLYPGLAVLALTLPNRTCQDAVGNWVNVSNESWERLVRCFVSIFSWFVCFLVWLLWEVYSRFHSSESQFPTSFGHGVEQTIRAKWYSQSQSLSPSHPLLLSSPLVLSPAHQYRNSTKSRLDSGFKLNSTNDLSMI